MSEEKVPSETQLYVSNLPFSYGDDDLARIFSEFQVRKAYVATRRNGRSKGFGFVDLESTDEQQRALSTINELELEGRKLVVSVAHRDERRDDSGVIKEEFRSEMTKPRRAKPRGDTMSDTIVYVANIPFEYQEDDLQQLFAKHNPVNVKIARRRNRSKGFGFVELPDNAAQIAALEFDGYKLAAGTEDERIISVKVSRVTDVSSSSASGASSSSSSSGGSSSSGQARARAPREPRSAEDAQPSETTLYVSNLPFELTDEELGAVFSDRGVQPVRAHVARRRGNDRSKGFGFVVFADQDAQQKALAATQDVTISERLLNVKIARKGSEKPPEERAPRAKKEPRAPREKKPSDVLVYVSNLAFDIDDEQLSLIFQEFEVKVAHVARRHNGRSKGFGFVEFASHEVQQQALAKSGITVQDRVITVEVAHQPAPVKAE